MKIRNVSVKTISQSTSIAYIEAEVVTSSDMERLLGPNLIGTDIELIPIDGDKPTRLEFGVILRERCMCTGEIEIPYIPSTASEIAEWRSRHSKCLPGGSSASV